MIKNLIRGRQISPCKIILILLLVSIFIGNLIFFLFGNHNRIRVIRSKNYKLWPEFSSLRKALPSNSCFSNFNFESLEDLLDKLPSLNESKSVSCKQILESFSIIYDIKDRYSEAIRIPPEMAKHLQHTLKEDYNGLNHQRIIHITNQFTHEQNIYNPLRARRPVPSKGKHENIENYLEKIYFETVTNCDLCNYLQKTAADKFGRSGNPNTVRMSNTFKMDKWHGMVITRSHHPVNISLTDVQYLFTDGIKWGNEIRDMDSDYIFYNFGWDTLYKAGASQMHPHVHVMMTPDHYYGSMEHLRSAANSFFEEYGLNYFTKLVDIYSELNLAESFRSVVALSMMTGKGDMEVMILGHEPSLDLYSLLYFVIKAYQDHFGQFCYSASMIGPALGKSHKAKYGKVPAIIRIVSRGECLSQQNDISSFDLFLATYRIRDPYEVIKAIRRSIETYGSNQ